MEKNSIVEIFCGNYPDSHKTPNIASNPNFVFENDPAFLVFSFMMKMEMCYC